jgi:hypothetical protein
VVPGQHRGAPRQPLERGLADAVVVLVVTQRGHRRRLGGIPLGLLAGEDIRQHSVRRPNPRRAPGRARGSVEIEVEGAAGTVSDRDGARHTANSARHAIRRCMDFPSSGL